MIKIKENRARNERVGGKWRTMSVGIGSSHILLCKCFRNDAQFALKLTNIYICFTKYFIRCRYNL